jgi:hypothetical protein
VAHSNEAHPPSELPGRSPAGRCMARESPAAQARQLVRNAQSAGKHGRPAQPAQLMCLFFFSYAIFLFTSLLVVCLDGLQNWSISKTFYGLLFSPIYFQ